MRTNGKCWAMHSQKNLFRIRSDQKMFRTKMNTMDTEDQEIWRMSFYFTEYYLARRAIFNSRFDLKASAAKPGCEGL
jgi:hypothetical protein